MKIILNKAFGGYKIPQIIADALSLHPYDDSFKTRTNPKLIEILENVSSEVRGDMTVVEIPDTYTDYELTEYDGLERITYVVNGKLYHA